MLLKVAVGLFVGAVFFGGFILAAILRGEKTPKGAVLMHGALAISALISVFIYVSSGHNGTLLISSIVLLTMAALGGLTLLFFDVSHKPISKMLAIGHPVLALIGLGLLVIYFCHS